MYTSLAAEKNLLATSERDCTNLLVDIKNARNAIVDLWDRLEASRVKFNKKSCRVDELMMDPVKRDQLHAVELPVKELADYEAVGSLDLKERERLDVDCNKM